VKADLRPIGVRRGTLLGVVAEDLPELLRLYVGGVLNWNGATLGNYLSSSVWPFHACKPGALMKKYQMQQRIGAMADKYLPPLLHLSNFFRKKCTFIGHN
jgi:hypothetical protein